MSRPSVWRRWRRANKAFAFLAEFFWLRCPGCGTWFGGHEIGDYTYFYGDGRNPRGMCWKHDRNEGPGYW